MVCSPCAPITVQYADTFRRTYVLLSISLAVAVSANLALLFKVMGRLSLTLAQPVIILGWYISSFLLIGLVGAAPAHLTLPAGQPRTFSQAFYYACFAAALYFILATLMSVTAWNIYGHRVSRDYKLTMAQRTLMVQVSLFLGYLLCAAAVYMRVEGWAYLDAVYWVDVTLFTIGFGDFKPATHLGRGLFFPMAAGGILFVGLIVASITSVVLERGSHKISRRNVEKARQKILSRAKQNGGAVRVSPTKKPDLSKPTAGLERGELEFNMMRQVQRNAGWVNATIALSVSVGLFLVLWLVGAVIFWQAEQTTQNWSYFESLYFVFVAFTTIGYGDFYPQDNSAKPAFVFWSMLALPTLTVLIGAVGNSISEGVNAGTVWMAENLPAKTEGLKKLKGAAQEEKMGDEGAFKSAKPPGFMEDGEDQEAQSLGSDTTGKAVQGMSGDQHPDGDKGKAHVAEKYRGYLLMRELRNVVDHVDASPPRKYTYEEWVWFLKLLGEDDKKWDWMGQRGPLMESVDEPRWVMTRLMARLEEVLKGFGDEQMEDRGH